jgi:hypothetical protein
MRYYTIKNWREFQHYKDRNPPWIKLHRTLLDDYEFACLQDASKLHLMLIWLLGSQLEGRIPDDPGFLKRKLGLNKEPDLKILENHGFLIPEQSASNALALDASKLHLEAEAYKASEKNRATPKPTPLPEPFLISERVKGWADKKGLIGLEGDLEFFIGRMRANGKRYIDWDEAFMNCIREDWGGFRKLKPGQLPAPPVPKCSRCGTTQFGSLIQTADGRLCNVCRDSPREKEAA